MIVICLSKVGDISYVSHIDYMRILQRALGRAGLEADRSQGFNKHPITYCSHPLPVGVQSNAEYFIVKPKLDYDLVEFGQKFQSALPIGLRVSSIYRLATNPNIAGKVVKCSYITSFNGDVDEYNKLVEIMSQNEIIMTFRSKDGDKSIDIKPLMHAMELDGDNIKLTLATGNPTLRPDKLIDYYNTHLSEAAKLSVCDTIRVSHVITDGTQTVTATEYLENNCIEKHTY